MTTPNDAVAVAHTVADSVVELAWATRPGQSLTDSDRYQVMLALTTGLGALAQVLTQMSPPATHGPPKARETFRAAVLAAHDLAAVVDTAAQHLT